MSSLMQYLSLGSTPAAEDCIQVSSTHDYLPDMTNQCQRYKEMLIAKFTNCDKVNFKIKSFEHDFGTYKEVVVEYDSCNSEATEQAFFIENNLPENWADTEIQPFVLPIAELENDEFED